MGAVRAAISKSLPPIETCHPAAADFFRVLATGMIGWFHIWQQSWVSAGKLTFLQRSGAAWVDALILLSAFCLFLPYANAMAQNAPCPDEEPLTFYKKRMIRILPAYYVNLLASLVFALSRQGGWNRDLVIDFASHLTLTQMFFSQGYHFSKLNGVTWTLTVLAVLYVIFPLLARAMFRAPAVVALGLAIVQLVWQNFVLGHFGTAEYHAQFNQFPAFASTVAIGMVGAIVFATLARSHRMQGFAARLAATLLGLLALWRTAELLDGLSRSDTQQRWQLENRTRLVLYMATALVFLALGLPMVLPRVWKFGAAISYSFYLWHQLLALWLKYDLHLPAWSGELPPNQMGDVSWMQKSNLLFWCVSLGAAIAGTYLVEKPAAVWLKKRFLSNPKEKSAPVL